MAEPARLAYEPTWIREREWNSPKIFSSQRTTAITTTPFKIDLMDDCMGMKRFTSHRSTPTTTRTSRSWIKGMIFDLSWSLRANASHPLEVLSPLVSMSRAFRVESCPPQLRGVHADEECRLAGCGRCGN